MNLLLADPHSTRPAASAERDVKASRSKNKDLAINAIVGLGLSLPTFPRRLVLPLLLPFNYPLTNLSTYPISLNPLLTLFLCVEGLFGFSLRPRLQFYSYQ